MYKIRTYTHALTHTHTHTHTHRVNHMDKHLYHKKTRESERGLFHLITKPVKWSIATRRNNSKNNRYNNNEW